MATIGQTLTSPESGWKRYDDKNSALKYTGTVVKNGGGSFYLTTGTSLEGIGDKLSFSFTGTKLTIMVYGDSGSSFSIMIDGVNEGVCKAFGYGVNKVVVAYTTETLSDTKHKVELTMLDYNSVGGNKQRVIFDAIDIDENGRLYHPDEVVDLKDLDIGKRIRCHYQAPSGVVGGFSGLGQETSDFIPTSSSATPNGDFYFIMVEDWNKKKILIADRNVQHSISWDALNTAGIASGSGLPLMIFSPDLVPVMTGATSGSVTVTGSHDNPWYCFDGNTYASNSTYYRMGGSGGYVQVDFGAGNEKAVTAYNLKTIDWSDPSRQPKDWKLEGSNNGADWVLLHTVTGEKFAQGQRKQYVFNNSTKYRFYKLTVTANNGNSSYTDIDDIEFFESIGLDSCKFTLRLLTGGVSSADNDNEWDKYIVNSTLNGTITAGDNSVWNWSNIWTWTSTTRSDQPSTHRTLRGYTISGYGSNTSNATANNSILYGFRPVFEIESPPFYKTFLLHNGEYKKYDTQWTTVSTTLPSVDTFIDEGMDDLSVFDRKTVTFNIQMDDNTSSGEALGNGRVFKEKINLKKLIQINSIKVK